MIFTEPQLLQDELGAIERIDQLRAELRYATQATKRWTGLLRRDAFARAIRGSNSIEGYNVTIDDALAAADDQEPLDANAETWAAVTGYRDALTYVLQLEGDPHFEHSEAFIRGLHYMMIKHDLNKHPGKWRPGPIRIVDERRQQIVYTGPDARLIPPLMRELVASLNATSESPVMVRAAMAHLNLTMIHPFSDGNGRMARALQTLVLVREGILSPTFCSIEEYLGRNQDAYYAVLAEVGQGSWHPENDCRPWIRFCLRAHYRCATDLLRRSREWQLVWDDIERERTRLGLPERVETVLVMAAMGRRVRNASYRIAAEISEQQASRDLKALTDMGLLVAKGEKRGRTYSGSERLLSIRNALREPRVDEDPFSTDEANADQPELPGL